MIEKIKAKLIRYVNHKMILTVVKRKIAEKIDCSNSNTKEMILLELTYDKSDIVKLNAIDSLSNGKSKETLNRLEELIEDTDIFVSGFAIVSYAGVFQNIYGRKELNNFAKITDKYGKDSWLDVMILTALYSYDKKKCLEKLKEKIDSAIVERDYRTMNTGIRRIIEMYLNNDDEQAKIYLGEVLKNDHIEKEIKDEIKTVLKKM